MSESYRHPEARAAEEKTSRDLEKYRNVAGVWMDAEKRAAREITFDFIPEPKKTLGIKNSKDNVFQDKNERLKTVAALEKLRDGLIAEAHDRATGYLGNSGVGRLLKESRENPGVLGKRAETLQEINTHDVKHNFEIGQEINHTFSGQQTIGETMSIIEKDAKRFLAADTPELARATEYHSSGFSELSPEIKQQQKSAEEALKKHRAEALVSWAPRLFKMTEMLIGELTALRKPEKQSKEMRPSDLDTKLPVDPFAAGLEKGMFDFAPAAIVELRKNLEDMKGAYPKALASRLDTTAEQYNLFWIGSKYEAKE